MEKVEQEEFDWIIIETGCNEVSNLDLRKSESEGNLRKCGRVAQNCTKVFKATARSESDIAEADPTV